MCVSVSVARQHDCLLRAAKTSVNQELLKVKRSVLDKVESVQLRIAAARSDVADVRQSLTNTDVRLTHLQQSFHALSDDLAELDSRLELDRYLERIIDELVQYGRAIRLVVWHVDPASTDDPRRYVASSPRGHRGERGHRSACQLRSNTHSERSAFVLNM